MQIRSSRLTRRTFVVGGTLSLAALARVRGTTTAASAGGTVYVGWDEPVPGPDPATDVSYPGMFINYNTYERLVNYDWDNAKIVPMLAQSWESSADNMTWTFKLNANAKFPSGRSLTAADVQWSLNRVLTINDPSNAQYLRAAIDEHSISVVDPHTVQIKLTKKYAAFLALMTMTASSVVDQKLVTPNVQNGDDGQAWLRQHSAGSGPFMLERWDRGQDLIIKRNDAYWGTEPALAEFELLVQKEATQQAMTLQGGNLEIAMSLLPEQLKALQTTPGFHVATGNLLAPYYLGMQMQTKPFTDPRVRQAVRLALDNESTIKELLNGDAIAIGGIIAPGLIGYDPSLVVKRDLPKAKALLAQAGLANGFSVPMRFQSGAVAGVGIASRDLAAKVQADLAEAGIKVSLVEQDPATLLPLYRAGKSPLTLWYWGPSYPDPDVIISSHGDKNTSGSHRLGFADDEITKLIEEARVEFDPNKRAALYKQAQQLTAERGPYAFLFLPKQLNGVSDRVQDYKILPIWQADMAKVSMK